MRIPGDPTGRERYEAWLGALHRMRVAHETLFDEEFILTLDEREFRSIYNISNQYIEAGQPTDTDITMYQNREVHSFRVIGVKVQTCRIIDRLAEQERRLQIDRLKSLQDEAIKISIGSSSATEFRKRLSFLKDTDKDKI